MLGNSNRLTSAKDFDLVKRKGKVFVSENFTIGFYKRRDKKPSRFGFIVSKNVSPEAVIRNKAKRGLREGVRHNITTVKPSYDCVVVAKPSIARRYTEDILREVKGALSAIDLI